MNDTFTDVPFSENSFDMLLFLASKTAGKSEIESYNSNTEEAKLSRKFLREMKKILTLEKAPASKTAMSFKRRLLVAIIAALLACALAAGGAVAIKRIFAKPRYDIKGNYYELTYDTNSEQIYATSIEEYKEPGYIPKGFVRNEIDRHGDLLLIEYRTDEILINYCQECLYTNYNVSVSNERADISYVDINGNTALLSIDHPGTEKERVLLHWSDGKYAYSLTGNISKRTMLKIARSIK